MNTRRGFFRLWILMSLFWIAGCAALGQSDISEAMLYLRKESVVSVVIPTGQKKLEMEVPISHGENFEVEILEISTQGALQLTTDGTDASLSKEQADALRQGIADRARAQFLLERGRTRDRFDNTLYGIFVVLAIPLAVLLIGHGFGWVFVGFKSPSS